MADNIIYKSNNTIPWDTQSAFKMTVYTGTEEKDLIFCYFKAYVCRSDLVVCTYTFLQNPKGKKDLTFVLSLGGRTVKVVFGYDGIDAVNADGCGVQTDKVKLNVFKSNDEQGFYWCGELTFDNRFIREIFHGVLCEGDTVGLNLIQNFEDGEHGSVFADGKGGFDAVGEFAISDY